MPETQRRVKIHKAQLKKVDDQGKILFRVIAGGLDWSVTDASEFEVVVILRDKSDNGHGADTVAVELVDDMPVDSAPPGGGAES